MISYVQIHHNQGKHDGVFENCMGSGTGWIRLVGWNIYCVVFFCDVVVGEMGDATNFFLECRLFLFVKKMCKNKLNTFCNLF